MRPMRPLVPLLILSSLFWLTVALPTGAQTPPPAEKVRERLWIWGHPTGVYNASYLSALPQKSSIEPVAAAQRMGISNMIFVRYDAKPAPPFAASYEPFKQLRRVYWSLVGADGATSADEREHVYRLAEANENIGGFILDDFFHETSGYAGFDPAVLLGAVRPFRASLTPEQLHELGQRQVRGRKLPIMAVVYTGQISPRAKWHLDEVDEICLWTWRPAELKDLEANLTALEKLVPGKPIYQACYMYDFDACRPLPVDLMQQQAQTGLRWLRQGRTRGMISVAQVKKPGFSIKPGFRRGSSIARPLASTAS